MTMYRSVLMLAACAVMCTGLFAEEAVTTAPEPVKTITVGVDSKAFVFSPGNWVGNDNRGGSEYRQTWNAGAYCRIRWTTTAKEPVATLLLDTSTYPEKFSGPTITYSVDGKWTTTGCVPEVKLENLKGTGEHELCVYLTSSQQKLRWGAPGESAVNVLRVKGLQLDETAKPVDSEPDSKWALVIGDSITEGIGASQLASYSHLVEQSLRTLGYEYCNSACGWSGWLNKGDNPPGDVPGYYVISDSENGQGGTYHDDLSRWNKIDGNNHSLLDSAGHISGYGQTGQEPALIMINYGTNDILHKSNPSDTFASMVQGLAALRKSAPDAQLVVLIPFGQFYAAKLKEAVEIHRSNHPDDKKIDIIDLGLDARNSLNVSKGLYGGLHPNDRGCANFAAQIIPQLVMILAGK